jgi:hypothetical protein
MKKGKKNKLFAIIGIFMTVVLIAGVFMSAESNSDEVSSIEQKTEQLSDGVVNYVEDFASQKGISEESINNVTKVNFDELPKEVNIENVNDANLAIYQINYNKSSSKQEKIFVITYSVDKLKAQGDIILSQDKREFLNFGLSGTAKESRFLKSAAGVDGSSEKGYVMMRSGSITGISTSLETTEGAGNLEIVIYRNGKPIQFGNTFAVDSAGTKKDYDVQSKGTVSFEAGDTISAYIKSSDGIAWRDVNTLIEITTSD